LGGSGWILVVVVVAAVVVVGLVFVWTIDGRIAVVAVVVVLLLDCWVIDYRPLLVVGSAGRPDPTSEPAAAAVVINLEVDRHCCYLSVDDLVEAQHHREGNHAITQEEAAAANDPSWQDWQIVDAARR